MSHSRGRPVSQDHADQSHDQRHATNHSRARADGSAALAQRPSYPADEPRVADIEAIAAAYAAPRFPDRDLTAAIDVAVDESFCIEVARRYDSAAGCEMDADALSRYAAFKQETLDQYTALVGSGVTVRPWLDEGQPYSCSAELHERVRATSVLYVFLTRCGHGPCAEVDENHPMCETSPIEIDGEPMLYNDLFRAVHDAFGHVMHGNDFGIAGEFRATYEHLLMYSADAKPAVFAETIGQVCWFYYGPHLLGPGQRVLRPGDEGYVPPADRPYPVQKVLLFPDELMDRYDNLFERIAA